MRTSHLYDYLLAILVGITQFSIYWGNGFLHVCQLDVFFSMFFYVMHYCLVACYNYSPSPIIFMMGVLLQLTGMYYY